jgi:hypothetical protein
MSWTDTVLSNTVGVAFRAATGNVDPWTLQSQKDDIAAQTTQALGPDADPAVVAQQIAAAQSQVDVFLKSTDAHPDQATLRLPIIGALDLPKIKSLVDGVLIVAAVGAVIYFGLLYHKTLGREFNKLKEGR